MLVFISHSLTDYSIADPVFPSFPTRRSSDLSSRLHVSQRLVFPNRGVPGESIADPKLEVADGFNILQKIFFRCSPRQRCRWEKSILIICPESRRTIHTTGSRYQVTVVIIVIESRKI